MKVKIGRKTHDSNDKPIMLILSDQDKKNIGGMEPNATKYCVYPEGIPFARIQDFMRTGGRNGIGNWATEHKGEESEK